jgi:type II secretory ATPase GspE/PulE/Tfp pilus assembly ATPase PilB-like protein/ActR/RegA family two-component response regulator
MASQHWLVLVVKGAGFNNVDALLIEHGDLLQDAWKTVRDVCEVSDDEIVNAVAERLHLNVADLKKAAPRAVNLVPEKVARRYQVFPLREDDRCLFVASSDPMNLQVEDAIAFASGRTPVFEVASPTSIQEAIDNVYAPEKAVQDLIHNLSPQDFVDDIESVLMGADGFDSISVVEEVGPEAVAAEEADAAPVIKLGNLILRDAIEQRASDIHIEPGRDGGTVRFRVDGVMRTYMQMPMSALNRVVSRIKVIGELDISDRMRPQDGRVRIGVSNRNFDLRISTVPTRDSEKVVIRILDPEATVDLDSLGLAPADLSELQRLLSFREGIFVVTGPTGSGKTTTLYSCLRQLATGEVNVMTVEDPVEYELPGITQMQVEPRRDFTFATALRAILRQDPDIIFVGEIRDLETADIAVQASMTGHFVLATLHTNDAVGAVQRLVDLGLERSSIAEALIGSLAQRLVRRVCAKCAQPVVYDLSADEERLEKLYGVSPVVRAVGCDECGNSGYRGRMPLTEIAPMTKQVRDLMAKGATSGALYNAVVSAGMRPLREAAVDRVRQGDTTLQELDRVIGEPDEDPKGKPDETRVLLVDDDAGERALARILLEKNDFVVTEAENGLAALDALDGPDSFSLMMLDLNMPGMDGLEVLKRVRSSVLTAGLPVVVLTSAETPETEVELMEEGADDYIVKPIDPPRFVVRIKAALRRAGASST